jgi:hypothetical protein
MDGIIQNNQPLFILVWAGSILSIIITLILGIMNLIGTQIYILILASILYLVGVQLPTFRFNIPLNNSLQNLDIESLDESEAALCRVDFETHGIVGTELELSTPFSPSQCCFYFSSDTNFHPTLKSITTYWQNKGLAVDDTDAIQVIGPVRNH